MAAAQPGEELAVPVDLFEQAWTAYPARAGGNSKVDARKAWDARLSAGVQPEDIVDGVVRYASFCRAEGKVGTSYVKQAATFFGPGEHWTEAWRGALQAPARRPPAPEDFSGRNYTGGKL